MRPSDAWPPAKIKAFLAALPHAEAQSLRDRLARDAVGSVLAGS